MKKRDKANKPKRRHHVPSRPASDAPAPEPGGESQPNPPQVAEEPLPAPTPPVAG